MTIENALAGKVEGLEVCFRQVSSETGRKDLWPALNSF